MMRLTESCSSIRRLAPLLCGAILFCGCVNESGLEEVLGGFETGLQGELQQAVAATSVGDWELAFFVACPEDDECTPTPYRSERVRGMLLSLDRIDHVELVATGGIDDLEVSEIEEVTSEDGSKNWSADMSFDVVGTGTAELEVREGDVVVDRIPIETTGAEE